jgi:hypothetical protein
MLLGAFCFQLTTDALLFDSKGYGIIQLVDMEEDSKEKEETEELKEKNFLDQKSLGPLYGSPWMSSIKYACMDQLDDGLLSPDVPTDPPEIKL